MKDFFKHVLATIVGLLIFAGITTIFGFLAIMGLLITAGDTSSSSISNNSILVSKKVISLAVLATSPP